MSRAPSEKTMLVSARREIARLRAELKSARDMSQLYRTRATQAEQELAEWKARFDKLLEFRKEVAS